MGLLNYITAHSLDEDYAHVAEQKGPASPEDRRRNLHVASVVALALFGLLVTTLIVPPIESLPKVAPDGPSTASIRSAWLG